MTINKFCTEPKNLKTYGSVLIYCGADLRRGRTLHDQVKVAH
jgi:hypothetical protein